MIRFVNFFIFLVLIGCEQRLESQEIYPNKFHLEVGAIILPVDFSKTIISSARIAGESYIYVELAECDGTRIEILRKSFDFLSNFTNIGYSKIYPGVYQKSDLEYLTPSIRQHNADYVGPLYLIRIQAGNEVCAVTSFQNAQQISLRQ